LQYFRLQNVENAGLLNTWARSNKWYMQPFRQYKKINDRSRRADFISRMFFPFVFIVFNLVYWALFTPGYDPNEDE
jgi:hypothetical protein